jgi:hypothetical protein
MGLRGSEKRQDTRGVRMSPLSYLNYSYDFENELITGKFDAAFKKFKETCVKEGLNEDLLKLLLAGWKKSKYKESHKDTQNWGLGSQAVTYITKKIRFLRSRPRA